MLSGKQNYSWVLEIFMRGLPLQGFRVAFFSPEAYIELLSNIITN